MSASACGERGPAPQPPREFDPGRFVVSPPRLDAPYVATDYLVVDAMLAMADVRPGDFLIDLGSGDGRIVIAAARSHGARGLGVDIDPRRVAEAQVNARAALVTDRVRFVRQDLFDTPLGEADIVTLYLTPEVNLRLRPRILSQMRAGARVISHQYDMGDWRPDDRRRVGESTLYLWRVPANVTGRWIMEKQGMRALLVLEQHYQQFGGQVNAGGRVSRLAQGAIGGERIRFVADLGDGRRAYEGRVRGNQMVPLSPSTRWRAIRIP
ncbi:MAG: SAM-dependent methyltransferase [Sphingosinicella sp.]